MLTLLSFHLSLAGCSREQQADAKPDASEAIAKAKDILVFPPELRQEDDSVNSFVSNAMETCAAGDYGTFRLLWSVREEPIPKAEYDEGWHAVEEIRILALEEIRLENAPSLPGSEAAADSSAKTQAYVIHARVKFDHQSRAGQKEPTRQVVLLIVKERDSWRLLGAPAKIRKWIEAKADRSPSVERPTSG